MSSPIAPVDRDALVAFAQKLVRTPSLSFHEGEVAGLVAEEMRRVGFDEVHCDEMGNVIGRVGSGDGRKLLFNGHMDTVDVGLHENWARDPFGGEIADGVLYGRGAVDMKGALAAMIYGARALIERGTNLDGTLYVVAVVQEEPNEGMAMCHVVEQSGLRPDWVVLGEATNLQLARGQRGRLEVQVKVQGRSAHAASPERGVNAVYGAARVVVALELLALQLSSDPFLGRGSIAVTDICSTADSNNAIPESCALTIDRRLTIGETEAKALAEIRRILNREGVSGTVDVPVHSGTSYNGFPTEGRQYFPYWVTPEDDPLLVTAVAAIEDVLNFVPHVGRWDFSTDGVYTAGVAGIPTIGFGPGDERYAHTVEDQVPVDDLVSAANVYAELATRLLRPRR